MYKTLFLCLLLHCLPLCASTSIHQFADSLASYPTYLYPYHDLEEKLEQEGKTSLLLFSYGSLMNKKSAGSTLNKEALSTYRYGLAFGVQRIFDRDVPIHPNSHWGAPWDATARGMLNISRGEHLEQFVNGVLIEVPISDIKKLIYREEGYNLIPVIVTEWDTFIRGITTWKIAYTLSAEKNYINPSILPRPGYYEVVKEAAIEGGPLFELLWYNTTYFADGRPIYIWEEWMQNGDERVKKRF